MAGTQETTVLVVDDEEKLANMFTLWLRGDYEVKTVYEGEAFLAAVDTDVDVVLLDRRMPGYSGDDVLEMLERRDADPAVIVERHLQMTAREHGDELQRFLRLEAKRRVLLAEHRRVALEGMPEWEELVDEHDELRDRLERTVDDFEGVLEAYRSSHRGGA